MITKFTNSGPLKLGEPLIKLDTVNSTNTYASDLLKNTNPPQGTVILTGFQTGGKGQGGNKWLSERNMNLLFSLILRPDFIKADKQFYLSMCISNGIAAMVGNIAGDSQIKWPNDILLNGRKVAGILIENTVMADMLHSTVAGIGLNVNQEKFGPELQDAVSLKMVTGREYNIDILLEELLEHLSTALGPLYNGIYAEIRTTYLNRLYRLNEWARFTDKNGSFDGRITDIADSGEIMVGRRDGRITEYGFKEIRF